MADANLSVSIVADLDLLSDQLNKATKEFTKFDSSVNKDLKDIDKGIKDLANSIEKNLSGKTVAAVGKASKALSEDLKQGARQADIALTDVGRVLQDLPFGFIGVQNNIGPLVGSLGRLFDGSQSLASGFKQLGSALIGPAGIGLAISAVTAGITFLSQNPDILKDFFDTITGGADSAAKAQKALNEAFIESASSVQGEISNVKSLVAIAKDESLSRNARLEAIQQLNKQYPELNNQLSLETINSKEATKAIDGLNKALLIRSKIAAVQDLIGEEFRKQLEAQNKSLISQASALDKVGAFFQAALGPAGIFKANTTLVTSGLEQQDKTIKSTNQTISIYEKTLTDLNKTLAQSGNLFVETPAKASKALHGLTKELQKVQSIGLTKGQKGISSLLNVPALALPEIDTSTLDRVNATIAARFAAIKENIGKFSQDVNTIIQGGLVSGLSNVGTAIGDALAQGNDVLSAIGASLLSTIGSVMIQLGELAIAAGLAVEAIKTALTSFTGIGAIAAGVALVALGTLVKGQAAQIGKNAGKTGASNPQSIPQFAGGVTGFSGGLALVGERGPELITMGRGSNVITNENIGRFMTQRETEIRLVGTVGISMGEFVVGIERQQKFNRRNT